MQSGKLRYSVSIEQQSASRTPFGSPVDSWAVLATVRAGIFPLTGRELEAAQKLNAEINTKITMRYLAGIVPEMRVNWTDSRANRTRLYDILGIADEEQRHNKMDLLCVERQLTTLSPASGPAATIVGYGRHNFLEAPDGVRTVFTLPSVPNQSVLQVYHEGVIQTSPDHYSVSGITVTFTFAPATGDLIFTYY